MNEGGNHIYKLKYLVNFWFLQIIPCSTHLRNVVIYSMKVIWSVEKNMDISFHPTLNSLYTPGAAASIGAVEFELSCHSHSPVFRLHDPETVYTVLACDLIY